MLKRKILPFLLSLSLCSQATAKASAYQCSSVFMTSMSDLLTQINKNNNNFLFQGKSLEQHTETLSLTQKKALRELLFSPALQRSASEEAMARHALAISEALFGKRDIADRFIKQSQATRRDESNVILFKEKLLRDGLLKVWRNEADPSVHSKLTRFSERVWTFMFSQTAEKMTAASVVINLGVLGKMPFFSPRYTDNAVSAETLFLVIRDGYAAHKSRVAAELKMQDGIEAYNTFSRLYQSVALSIVFVVLAQEAWDEYFKGVEEDADRLIKDLKDKREIIETVVPEIKKEQAKIAYEKSIQEFFETYGEMPTEAENKILYKKVVNALGAF